jgi:hypothetical protein
MRSRFVTLLLLCTACAPRYGTAALGQYEEYRPFMTRPPAATLNEAAYDIELTRQAFVSVIAIVPPAGGYEERPVYFQALYPRYDTDRMMFPAGKHRLRSPRTLLMEPRNCADDEKPALDGCRRAVQLLPGMLRPRPPAPSHYLLITADEFVDPYEVADDLYFKAMDDEELKLALQSDDTDKAAALLERALLDRRGSPLWAAFYLMVR